MENPSFAPGSTSGVPTPTTPKCRHLATALTTVDNKVPFEGEEGN